jgi:antitoxin ChpS
MYRTRLRKVGGSVMLAVPPAVLEMVDMHSGSAVDIDISHGILEVIPVKRHTYKLEDLLAASDYSQPMTDEEREWIGAPAAGRELL